MRNIKLPAVIITLLALSVHLFAAKWEDMSKIKVAVLEIDSRVTNEKIDTVAIGEIFQAQLSKRAPFVIVERSILNKILQEQKLELSGLTEADASKVGKLAGSDKVISGSLSRVGGKLVLIIKAVDVATGVLDFSDQIVAWTAGGLSDSLPEAAERLVKIAGGEKVGEFVIRDTEPVLKNISAPAVENKPAQISEPEISTNGLLLYYPFDNNAKDASGNKNNGIVVRSILAVDRFDRTNYAYWLNDTISYISSAKQIPFGSKMTLSMWFKTSTTTGGRLLGFVVPQKDSSDYDDPRQSQLYVTDEGHISLAIMTADTQKLYISSDETYNDGRWHQLTALISPEYFSLYLDGEQVKKETVKGGIFTFPGYLRIGYDNLAGWTGECTYYTPNALVDDLRLYGRLLSDEEIMKLYGK